MNAYRLTAYSLSDTHIHTNLRRVCTSTTATNFWKNTLMRLFPPHTHKHIHCRERECNTNSHLLTDLCCWKGLQCRKARHCCYLMCRSDQIPHITSAPLLSVLLLHSPVSSTVDNTASHYHCNPAGNRRLYSSLT